MKDLRSNVFIAHTPLQNFFISKIIEKTLKDSYTNNILITSVEPSCTANFKQVLQINKKNGILKVIQTYKAKRKLLKLARSTSTNFYISHTSALLDNYVFYTLKRKYSEIAVNFYYDGILYFYDYQEARKKSHKQRKLIGGLVGIKYHFKPRIFPFDSTHINKIYTTISKFTLGDRERHVEIDLLKNNYEVNEGRILILGGKPSLLAHTEVQDMYSFILDAIKEDKDKQIYFKGHHADSSNNFEIVSKDRLDYVDITQNSPIEEVIEMYNPCAIFSYPSSALINLKAMYGDKIKIECFYIKNRRQDLEMLTPIFEHMKINIELI